MFEWPAVFLINVPIMALLLVAGPFLLPESRNPRGATFDLPGAVLSLLALFGIVFAVKRFAEYGNEFLAWATLIGGALVMVGFIVRQRRVAHPLIDLTLFRRSDFSGAAIANLLAAFVMVGIGALAFTYLQSVHGLSALEAALYALPTFIGTAVGAAISAGLAKRVRPGMIIVLGFAIAATGFVVIGATAQFDSPWWFVAGYTLLTMGTGGIVSALANSLIISTAPAHRTGAATSISETGVQLGGAFGIALFGLLSTLFYRREMPGDGQAGESLAGAEALAAQMSGPEAAPLLQEQAASAFASSMGTVAFLLSWVCLAAAIVAGLLLRRVPIGAGEDSDG